MDSGVAGVLESVVVERETAAGFDGGYGNPRRRPGRHPELALATAYQVGWVGADGLARSDMKNCVCAVPMKPDVALGLRFPITDRPGGVEIAIVWIDRFDEASIRVGEREYPIPIRDGLNFWRNLHQAAR